MIEVFRTGRAGLLATRLKEEPVSDPVPSHFLYLPEAQPADSAPNWLAPVFPLLPQILEEERAVLWPGEEAVTGEGIFLEPLLTPSRLVIFGAGHVSAALCPLSKGVGFSVTVIDDRPEFANPQRFPEADLRIVQPWDQADAFPTTDEDFLVILTRGHQHDLEVLRRLLPKPFAYLGMIGSRRKGEKIFQTLREEGFPEERIAAVHTPIGLEIGAETPEEIAVSILAQLIQVRARRKKAKTGG